MALTADLYVGAERGETLPRNGRQVGVRPGWSLRGGTGGAEICLFPRAECVGLRGSIFLGALAGGLFGEKFFQTLFPDSKSVSLLRQDLRRSLDPISQFGCYLGVNDPFC